MVQRRFEASTTINATPEEIFSFATNPNNLTLWTNTQGVKDIDKTELKEAFEYIEIHNYRGNTLDVPVTIIEYEQNKKWSYKCEIKGYKIIGSYTLEQVGEGTKITSVGEIDIGSMFTTSIPFHLFSTLIVKTQLILNLKKLKKLLEEK